MFAYQIMTALAIYLMTTAVMDQSPSFMLNHQTRMLLSIGMHTSSHETQTTLVAFCRLHMHLLDSCRTTYLLLSKLSTELVNDLSCSSAFQYTCMCTENQHCAILYGLSVLCAIGCICRDQDCKFLMCVSYRHHRFDFEHTAGAHW